MVRFFNVLILIAVMATPSFAAVDLSFSGALQSQIETIGGTFSDSTFVSGQLGGTTSITNGASSSSATFGFTNAGNVASFDFNQITQTLVWDPVGSSSFGQGVAATLGIVFELNEAASYVITGSYSGTSTLASTDVTSLAQLRKNSPLTTLFREDERAAAPATYLVNGLNDSGGFFDLIGSQSGTISPGIYTLNFAAGLFDGQVTNVLTGTGSGSYNLTLTSVPEPSAISLWSVLLGGLALRRRR